MINFIKYRKLSIGFAFILCVISLLKLYSSGLNYGIDFSGGVSVQIKGKSDSFEKKYNATQISNSSCMLKCAKEDLDTLNDSDIESIKIMGAKSGNNNLLYATIITLIAMMLYIWMKFHFSFAAIAIIALIHDIILIIGFYTFTGNEINETAIIVFLSIIAYSINDTVVIFDRLRETKELTYANINYALNSTMKRTLNTSITTLMSLIALSVFGGLSIQEFSNPMLVGIIAGTYSSIFIAGSLTSYIASCPSR